MSEKKVVKKKVVKKKAGKKPVAKKKAAKKVAEKPSDLDAKCDQLFEELSALSDKYNVVIIGGYIIGDETVYKTGGFRVAGDKDPNDVTGFPKCLNPQTVLGLLGRLDHAKYETLKLNDRLAGSTYPLNLAEILGSCGRSNENND